jgi:uncharacterized protein YsxB (DUF464 family)
MLEERRKNSSRKIAGRSVFPCHSIFANITRVAAVIRIKEHHSDLTFTVDESTVSATGTIFLEGEQSFGFNLDQISPIPIVIERRHPDFRRGLYWLTGGFAALAFRHKVESEDARVIIVCAAVPVLILGTLLVITFMRKIKIITVTNHNGQGLFSLIRTRGNSAAVDELLALILVKQ